MIEVAFTGKLGRDAELRHVKGGTLPLLSFSAVVEGRDESPEQPRWIRVALFGDRALDLTLAKGSRVYVEGKLAADVWQPEAGAPRVNLNVTASLVQPLGQIGRRRPKAAPAQRPPAPVAADQGMPDDAIPF